MEKKQLLVGEGVILYICCHGIENLLFLLEDLCLLILERRGEIAIAYCSV